MHGVVPACSFGHCCTACRSCSSVLRRRTSLDHCCSWQVRGPRSRWPHRSRTEGRSAGDRHREAGRASGPSGPAKRKGKGGKGKEKGRESERGSEEAEGHLLRVIAQLLLRHEDAISILRADKGMLFFLKTGGQESFLPTLFNLSQAWNKEREKPIAQRQEPLSPLRIVLVKAFLSEMAARITKVTEDPEVRKKVIAAGWATQEADQTLSWHFQMYDAEKKQEHVDQGKPPLPHARIMQLLEGVAESLRPEVVQRFHATRPQAESYQGPVVVFMMEVAHRGEYAKVLYRNMADLAHNMVWNLMASRMRLETIGRSPLANRIAQLLADQSEPCV